VFDALGNLVRQYGRRGGSPRLKPASRKKGEGEAGEWSRPGVLWGNLKCRSAVLSSEFTWFWLDFARQGDWRVRQQSVLRPSVCGARKAPGRHGGRGAQKLLKKGLGLQEVGERG